MCPPSQDQSRCFRELFEHPQQWEKTRAAIDVLFHADHLVDRNFTDDELRAWFAQLQTWKLKFALEVGAIKPYQLTGEKAFNGRRVSWDRFQRLGANLYAVAMDEPLVCTQRDLHRPVAYAVQETAAYIALVRKHYPQMLVGDIEGYPRVPYEALVEWIDALQAELKHRNVRGLDFFRLDVDWCHFLRACPGNWGEVKKLESDCRRRKLPFGLVYWAADLPHMQRLGLADDSTWFVSMMQQGYDYAYVGGAPDQYVLQSWVKAPAHSVPESDPWSFTRSVLDFTHKFVKRDR
jgi:hypothetical protein